MMRLEFRGLYQSAYKQFLLEMGGCQCDETDQIKIEGEGWLAEFSPEDTVAFSNVLEIPRTFITFSGDPAAVQRVVAVFRLKALRVGG
jgi:hypothetical protein